MIKKTKVLEIAATTILALVVGSIVLGSLGRFNWLFELASHFQFQYFLSLAGVFLILFLLKVYGRAGIALLFCLISLSNLSPYLGQTTSVKASGHSADSVRVMFFNTWVANTDYNEIADIVSKENPDVVVLAEIAGIAYSQIEELLPQYPYSNYQDGHLAHFDIAYFSRLPVKEEKIRFLAEERIPTLDLVLTRGEKDWRLIGVHTRAPLGGNENHVRNEHLLAVAKLVKESDLPVVVVGDLNITPWSPIFKDFLAESGLVEARLGKGLLPSWNTTFPSLFRIPIDHILVSPDIGVSDIWTDVSKGSDHLPMLADLNL